VTSGKYKYLIKWVDSNPLNQNISWEVPHKNLRKWIKLYNNNKRQTPVIIPWNFFQTDPHCTITKFTNALHNINFPIQWHKQAKYLGCMLTNLPNQNTIIEPHLNYSIFKAKYRARHNELLTLSNKYSQLHLKTKLNLVKAFCLPYSNLFPQIIPFIYRHNWEIRNIHMNHVNLFLNFNINSKNHCLSEKFLEYLNPKWRWVIAKLNFCHHMKITNLSICHNLLQTQILPSH